MKFSISSTLLSQNLQTAQRVISSKNTLPILDYILFQIDGSELHITGSDLETTLRSTAEISNQGANGAVALPAKRMADSLREFSEQPLQFEINAENWECTITWSSGKLVIPGTSPMGYPEGIMLHDECMKVVMNTEVLSNGISSTIFASSSDPMRPVLCGVNVEIGLSGITFVATDAYRVVKLHNKTATSNNTTSFIIPQKSANMLKNILPKDPESEVVMAFDKKNAIFTLPNYTLIVRLVDGIFPDYNAVIPKANDKVVTIGRTVLISALRRVSSCCSQVSGLVQISLNNNNIGLTAQDIDFATSAEDNLTCQYDGDALEIGFKASLLREMLEVISTDEIQLKFADQTKPGLFLPFNADADAPQDSELIMLLMPMTINA